MAHCLQIVLNNEEVVLLMKSQKLFVTSCEESMQEGISYVVALAKATNEYIYLLLVHKKKSNIADSLGNLMTTVRLAHAEKHNAYCLTMTGGSEEAEGRYEKMIGDLPDPGIVSISLLDRTPKPKRVFCIFARSPDSMEMMPSLSLR